MGLKSVGYLPLIGHPLLEDGRIGPVGPHFTDTLGYVVGDSTVN